MKNFTFLFTLMLLTLGFGYRASATNDCNCPDNVLKNASFESNNTNNWSVSNGTSFTTSTGYNMCGTYNAVINGSGSAWQEIALDGGSDVAVKVYGGTHHNQYTHEFKLIFYNAGGTKVGDEVVKAMNYEVGNGSSLQLYQFSGKAPATATKVRFSINSSGDYFKVDGACLTITPPAIPVDCGCVASAGNPIKNGSFEGNTNNWSKSNGTNFGTDQAYNMCGDYNGLISGSGTVWQDVALVAGSKVDLSVYGGTHDNSKTHQFKLTFYDGAGNKIDANETVVDMNYEVGSGNKLKQYQLSATAPAGATKVRFSFYSSGDYFKIDVVCMSITTPAVCDECTNNTLQNGNFENGTNGWSVTGTLTTEAIYAVCGSNGGKLSGAGKFWQDVEMLSTYGGQVSLTIYGAYSSSNSQKFQLVFLSESQAELGQITKDVTKSLSGNPWGLEKYTLAGAVPSGTKYVRVLASSTGNNFLVDNACLTFSGPPLPVTLSAFNAKKEGTTAQLTWTTTSESNSAYFEVQHSQDGKKWTVLTSVDAKGESRELVSYSYTHTSPLAINLYRLKMVDLDETFAFSAIKNLNFDGDEQMNIYPNPTVDRIRLSSNQQISNVKLYNQSGVLVMNTVPDSANEVDLTRLVQGTYFVKINNGPLMRKILVVR
nr:T9SS type A sorting domain-containing protein [uncultured Dyadobacter sp.]